MCITKKVNMDRSEDPTADREYKDRLFRFVFNNREDLLSLYNAVAGTSYTDPDSLGINIAKLYEKIIAQNNINIYSSGAKKFPFPQHIVFYN